ncbi:hypothetical protein EDD15DRAFT_2198851 [Pisolithus albus]|nr:hypothetical protein EDD15DRAFT_2198851 [Pisolithus albus]
MDTIPRFTLDISMRCEETPPLGVPPALAVLFLASQRAPNHHIFLGKFGILIFPHRRWRNHKSGIRPGTEENWPIRGRAWEIGRRGDSTRMFKIILLQAAASDNFLRATERRGKGYSAMFPKSYFGGCFTGVCGTVSGGRGREMWVLRALNAGRVGALRATDDSGDLLGTRIWEDVVLREVGGDYLFYHVNAGVDVRLGVSVTSIGRDDCSVGLSEGDVLRADVVVAAVGGSSSLRTAVGRSSDIIGSTSNENEQITQADEADWEDLISQVRFKGVIHDSCQIVEAISAWSHVSSVRARQNRASDNWVLHGDRWLNRVFGSGGGKRKVDGTMGPDKEVVHAQVEDEVDDLWVKLQVEFAEGTHERTVNRKVVNASNNGSDTQLTNLPTSKLYPRSTCECLPKGHPVVLVMSKFLDEEYPGFYL